MLIPISSLDDPRLEAYRNLKDTNRTRWAGRFVVEGEKLARRLIESAIPVDSLLLSERFSAQWDQPVPDATPNYVIPDNMVEALVGFNFHRGILACGIRADNPPLDRLAPLSGRCTVVICPDVQDPENLGSILRSAAALGVNGVLTGREAPDPFSRRVLRVSMGASLRLPVRQSPDIMADLLELSRQHGVQLIATVLDPSAEPLSSITTRPERLGLVLGSEGHGLRGEVIALCDRRVTIPMQPGTDSLNVAVAAGIFLHHFQ